LSREEAERLLERAQSVSKEVKPERLGLIGANAFPGAHAVWRGFVDMPPAADGTRVRLPTVIEAWADLDPGGSQATFLVNGSPCITCADASYDEKAKTTTIYGPALKLLMKTGKTGIWLHLNIFTPFMMTTSDGKEPLLGWYAAQLKEVIAKAVKRARQSQPREVVKTSVKQTVFLNMQNQIVIVSDNRRYRFQWRQVFYRVRPFVEKLLGRKLGWGYFSQTLIRQYEERFGEEKLGYRDARGTFYNPRTGQSFPLGTLQVENYKHDNWGFSKVLYIEKEGFDEVLKADGWPQRNDCALMTSKGQPTRAARDLIDKIASSGEPIAFLCAHDCDPSGTIVFQSLQEATLARPERNVRIYDFGLNVSEAKALAAQGLIEIEDIVTDETTAKKKKACARYVSDDDRAWFEYHRAELNAFRTPDLIRWLDEKMAAFGAKLIPPENVLAASMNISIEEQLRAAITTEVLADARIEHRVQQARTQLARQVGHLEAELSDRVATELAKDPVKHWSNVVDQLAASVVKNR
jgi:hypothetical protein